MLTGSEVESPLLGVGSVEGLGTNVIGGGGTGVATSDFQGELKKALVLEPVVASVSTSSRGPKSGDGKGETSTLIGCDVSDERAGDGVLGSDAGAGPSSSVVLCGGAVSRGLWPKKLVQRDPWCFSVSIRSPSVLMAFNRELRRSLVSQLATVLTTTHPNNFGEIGRAHV